MSIEFRMGQAKGLVKTVLQRLGYDIHAYAGPTRQQGETEFKAERHEIGRRYLAQNIDDVEALRRRCRQPILGPVNPWDLFVMLGRCIDPTDESLLCVSQLTHALQIAQALHHDGVGDRDLILTALLHDIGKLAMLFGWDAAECVGPFAVVEGHEPGMGLDRVTFTFGHGEIAYHRLKAYVPDHVAWLFRYHSIDLLRWRHLMDDRDRAYASKYLEVFRHYDEGTKSVYVRPVLDAEYYRTFLSEMLPPTIVF